MKTSMLGAVAAVAVSAVALVALGLGTAPPAVSKTLVYCSEGNPSGFNPSLFTDGTTFDASSRQLYNKLVEFERGTTNVGPGLAQSWVVSEDAKTYVFKLRPRVRFHSNKNFSPSRSFNADDVVFTFERQGVESHPFFKVSGGTYEYFNGMGMDSLIESVEKVDDLTVRFNLTRPEAPFIANLAMDFASILSAQYGAKMLEATTPEQVDINPVGTGPFQLVAFQPDATIRYKANDDYYLGRSPLDNLVFSITPDASVRFAKLQAGECHVMPFPAPADLAAMEADPNINLMQREGLNVGYLAYNTRKPPFDKAAVRKALNMAINKAAIIEAVFQGAGVAAKNPIPPTIWSYNDAIVDDPFDPAAAKRALAAAGFPNGFETDIWAMPVQRPYNPNAKRMAEMIQADWAAIGVRAKFVTYDWPEYLNRSKEGEHETVLLGWTGDNGDPDNFLAVLLGCDAAAGGSNRAFWCHQPFEDLILQAKLTSDIGERTSLYEQAQVIFKDQAPWATIAHSVVSEPIRKEVLNYKIDPFGGHIFFGVDLAE